MKLLSKRIVARKGDFDIGPDRLVLRILRCGRSNPGSNPGLDRVLFCTVDGKSLSRRHNRITGTNSDNEKTAEENKCEKRLVIMTLRCGRSNTGSNPGPDRMSFCTGDGNCFS